MKVNSTRWSPSDVPAGVIAEGARAIAVDLLDFYIERRSTH